jgi:zinc-ribbon domain
MAFCSTCGAQIPDGTTTCAACAGRAAASTPPPPTSSTGGMSDNVAGMLAYVTIIPAIIFLVMEPYNKSRFIRFHAFQCLFFAVAWTVLWIALSIVAHIPFLGWLTARRYRHQPNGVQIP